MNARTSMLGILGISVVTAWLAGYWMRGVNASSRGVLRLMDVPSAEYFADNASFSEVQNAKTQLKGLALRYRAEVQARMGASILVAARQPAGVESKVNPILAWSTRRLAQGIEEFQGTDHQLLLVNTLLGILRREAQHEKWVDVYLRALYQHPTHELVGRLAGEALEHAAAVGKIEEVLDGFRQVVSIPLEFSSKGQVQTLLLDKVASPKLVSCDGSGVF